MRLFIALVLPQGIKQLLLSEQAKLSSIEGVNLRFPKIRDAHITLAFLGDRADADELIEQMRMVKFKPFSLTTSRRGIFKREEVPAVFWIGLGGASELLALQKQVTTAISFEENRKYKAHLTLARSTSVQKQKGVIEWLQGRVKPIKFRIDSFALFSSKLTPIGPEYEELWRY